MLGSYCISCLSASSSFFNLWFSALDGKPGNAAELFERVSQSIKVKRYSEALNDLNAAIEADPALSEAYYHRASILHQICRYEESEKSYKKFLELKPQDSVAEKELSQLRGYLGPYKSERYHLPDFRRGAKPTGQKEVFNHMHSSLRCIIERTFGVWKKRWAILRDMPNYPFNKQVKIVIATMALHNYIQRYSERDRHFDDPRNFCEESDSSDDDDDDDEYQNYQVEGSHEIEALRNRIATSLMNASN